jgi:hypothetical protein
VVQQIKRGVAVVIDGYIYRCFLGGDVARGRQVSEEENIIGHHRDDASKKLRHWPCTRSTAFIWIAIIYQ